MGKHRKSQSKLFDYSGYRAQAPAPELAYPGPLVPPPAPSITISVLGAKNATVAKAQLLKPTKDWTGQEYLFEAAESSKREQGDVYDPVTGEMLALARVLQRLSRNLFSEANKRVKQSADEQYRQQVALERKTAASKKPVKGRTKEEWEAMQRGESLKENYASHPAFAKGGPVLGVHETARSRRDLQVAVDTLSALIKTWARNK